MNQNIPNNIKLVDDYINSDERLQKSRSILERDINGLMFEKLIKASQGVRKIHYIDYNGNKIPLRLLTMKEETLIEKATHLDFKNYPEFTGGENNPLFERIKLIKSLSKATTSAPEVDDPHLSEDEVWSLPPVAFWYLIREYRKLNDEYNLAYNPNMEDDMSYIFNAIFDGAPLNEKKLALLSGLTSTLQLQALIRLCNVIIKLEDNTQYITLLSDSTVNE